MIPEGGVTGAGGRRVGMRLRGALADGAVAGLHAGLRAAPSPLALTAGRALGALSRTPLRLRRRVVESQIAASFPAAPAHWVRATARACYLHFGREVALLVGGPRRLERTLALVGDPGGFRLRLRAAVARRGGAVVVSGHLGNWELGAAAVRAAGVPVTTIAQPQQGAFGRRLAHMRARFGLDVLDRGAPARPALAALRSGRALALVADQHARRGSTPVDFLGRHALTSLGPARLCLAADVPLFFAALVRDRSGYSIVHEEIARRPSGAGADAVEITRRWVRALERQIRQRPEQYFWFHRRWRR